MKTASKVIAAVLIFLLLAGIIGVVFAFTNGGNEEFKTFYIERDGKKILASETSDVFYTESSVTYSVHYTFDVGTMDRRDYIVKILPNEEQSFDYMVDGERTAWKSLGEKAALPFRIDKGENGFTVTSLVGFDGGMKNALELIHPGKRVELPEDFDTEKPYFTLYVASYNEAVRFYIRFSLQSPKGPIVRLDKTEIIF